MTQNRCKKVFYTLHYFIIFLPPISVHIHTHAQTAFFTQQLLNSYFLSSFSPSPCHLKLFSGCLLFCYYYFHSFIHSFIRCCGITRSLRHIEALTFTFNSRSLPFSSRLIDHQVRGRQRDMKVNEQFLPFTGFVCTDEKKERGREGRKFGEIGKRIFCFLVQSFYRDGSGGGGGMQIISLSVSVSFRFNTFIFSVLSLALSFFSLYLTHCPTKTGRAWPNWLPKLALTGRQVGRQAQKEAMGEKIKES